MNYLKQYIFCLLTLCIFHVSAQVPRVKNLPTHDDRVLHFGFNIGLNTMDFRVENLGTDTITGGVQLFADLYRLKPGFHVSIVSNLRLNEYMDLRFLPGIAFGQRELFFTTNDGQPYGSGESGVKAIQKLNSSFIDFPLLIKFKAERINNFRPYVVAGGNIRLDLASKKEYEEEKEIYLRLKSLDYYYEMGIGFDFYLQYFKLSTELKYSIGIRDVSVHDPPVSHPEYIAAIDYLKSRIIMLSFYFE